MRVLLDECIPADLLSKLSYPDVTSVHQMGWTSKKNGELLTLMQKHAMQVLITVDQNLHHQQNLSKAGIAVITIKVKATTLPHLLQVMDEVMQASQTIPAGTHLLIDRRI